MIEAYFGGSLARDLQTAGKAAMIAFACEEIAAVLGAAILARLRPLGVSSWAVDPLILGSYSHAEPGHAHAGSVLNTPIENRIFFAGEAYSIHDFSTCAATAFESLNRVGSSIVALNNWLRIGPTPEMVIGRPLPIDAPANHRTFREIVYTEEAEVGYLSFDFYNGAMSTSQLYRLRDAFLHARSRPTRVIVLLELMIAGPEGGPSSDMQRYEG